MPQTSVIFGLAMCGLTVFGMMGSPEKLATAFIPMMLGIPLFFCGIVSLNPHRRKSWMWVAGIVAVLGLVTSFGRLAHQLVKIWEHEWVNRFSLGLLWGVFGLCLVYLVVLAFDLLRQHRRRRGARAAERNAAALSPDPAAVNEPAAHSEPATADKLAPPPAAAEDTPRAQSVSSSLGA